MTDSSRSDAGAIVDRQVARRGLLAVVLSVLLNWIVLQAVLTLELVEPFEPLTFPPVTLLTVLGAVAATVGYVAIRRFSETPDRTFTYVAAIALLLSFLPTVALLEFDPEATVPAVAVLMFMHVAVAVVCVASLTGRLID